MKFTRTKNEQLIRSIATHPKIWSAISDDIVHDPAKWNPVMHDGIWYVLAKENDATCGLFIFFPENSITWQVHVCLLPEFWGRAGRALREVFVWLWEKTPCLRITGSVPIWNASAIHCALRAGMKPYGVNEHSALKYSQLHHQLLLGISKPEKAVPIV